MRAQQHCNWYRIIISLTMASLFSFLAYTTLMAVSVAASDKYPDIESADLPTLPLFATSTFMVTGTVKDQNGTLKGGVQVFAFSGAFEAKEFTDNSGQYTITLSTGNFYDIVFNPPAGSELASQVRRGIAITQELNVTLPPGHSISGTVYSQTISGPKVNDVAIFAFNEETFDGFGLPPTQDGTFQVALTTGTWKLTFTPPHFSGLGPKQIAITLTNDITQDVVLPAGFTVYGQVITSGGGGLANVEIFAQDPITPGFGFSPTGLSGHYTGTLPVGNYDILYLAPPFKGLGSDVKTNISGPSDVLQNVTLPAGYTVSGTVRCNGMAVANAFVDAAPHPSLSAGRIGSWGRFAGSNGFYALALQSDTYTFTIKPPNGSPLPKRVITSVVVAQDMTLNVDYDLCTFFPIIFKQ